MTAPTDTLPEEKPVERMILVLDEVLKSEEWEDLSEGNADGYSTEGDSFSCWSNSSDECTEDLDLRSRVSLMSLDALLVLRETTTPRKVSPAATTKKRNAPARVPNMDIRSQRFQYRKARPAPLTRQVNRSESLPKRMPRVEYTKIEQNTSAQGSTNEGSMVKPSEHYLELCERAGKPVTFIPLKDTGNFYLPNKARNSLAFSSELVDAVRSQNLKAIKALVEFGHSLNARSPVTGESIIHVCVRRGTPEILKYMIREAKLSPRVCCDYGRSPLHDACWSNDARALELMKVLIQECPDMLMLNDKRGFSPLDYIPRDRWAHCCAFLDKHQDMILPRGLLEKYMHDGGDV